MKQKLFFIILVLSAFFLSCDSLKLIKSGRWTANADFGAFEFVVDSAGTSITEITFNWSNWHGISGSITVSQTPGWSITDREFEIECDLGYGISGQDLYTITGTFSDNGKEAEGSWTEAVSGTTYSGSWEGEWTDSSAFIFK